MIINMKRHTGSKWLATHLLRTDVNEWIKISAPALMASDMHSAFDELNDLVFDTQTEKPFVHVIMNPSMNYTEDEWHDAWYEYEKEFGIEGQPFVSARHMKRGNGGRLAAHEHRLYLWIDLDGKVIRDDYCAIRAQKVARICEYQTSEPMVSGSHNRAIHDQLNKTGYSAVAAQMQRLGLLESRRPEAVSSNDRQKTERANDIAADEVGRLAFEAWQLVQNGTAFEERLKERGLHLCTGTKVIGVITERGVFHDLRRMMSLVARARSAKAPKKADIVKMIGDMTLPSHTEVLAGLNVQTEPTNSAAKATGLTRLERALKAEKTPIIANANKPNIPSPAQRLERKRVPTNKGTISKPREPAIKLDDGARQMLNAAFDAGMQEIGNEALEQLEYLEPQLSSNALPTRAHEVPRSTTPHQMLSEPEIVLDEGARQMLNAAFDAGMQEIGNEALEQLEHLESQLSTNLSQLSAEPAIALDAHTRRMLRQAFDEGMKEIGNNALEHLMDTPIPTPEEVAGLEANEAVLTAKRAVQKPKDQYLSTSEVQEIEAEAPDISIDVPTSKDTYKAMLANVDRHYGSDIHFVHKVSVDKKIIELKDRSKIRVSRASIKCANPTAKAVEIAIAAAVSSGATVFAIRAHENWIYELAYELAEAHGITLVNKDWDHWCLMRDSEPIHPSEASDPQSNDEVIDSPAPRF
ncbi:relaxase/mobilization nuclease domain-containing protein [Ahrensia kielensis]|uniref:relaxase/mobilization nuclease domain-containing protein n=1 Tax=Ahrensia kielensis TaxID=76980 RepID=UPI0003733E1C|nr:hypothetical protein [Ahrensia kielensis]